MNKFLIGVGTFAVIVVAAIVVGPGMIDWNSYKADLTEQAEHFTGRKLTIDGAIEISILPAPALVAHDVHLSNVEGASAVDMVNLKSLQVRIALAPLLSGQLKVQTIQLVDPVIELERFADGRTNMAFTLGEDVVKTAAASNETAPQAALSPSGGAGGAGGADFSLDNFVVENATVIYRDAVNGTVERIEKLDATFAAASLDGPFESAGSLIAHAIPLEFNVSIGKIIEQRTAPVSVTINLQPGGTKATVSGAIVGLADTPTFKGLIKATGTDLSGLIQSLGPKGALPGFLGQDFSAAGEVEVSAIAADVANLSVSLGSGVANGTANMKMEGPLSINVDLGIGSIDVDKWLAMPVVKKAVTMPAQSKQENVEGEAPKTSVSLDMPDKVSEDNLDDDGVGSLPSDIEATLNFKADSLTLNGGLVRDATLSAALSGGEITINQLSALLPGSADVALFGFVTTDTGQPGFAGDMEVSVGDLRGLMGWLGAPPPPVPSDRLRKLTVAGKFAASAQNIMASDLDIQFDSSRLMGKASMRLTSLPGFDADLTLDRINLDAYLLPAAASAAAAAPTAATTAKTTDNSGKNAGVSELALFAALKNIDANLKAHVQTLVYAGAQIKNVKLDGSINKGVFDLRNFSVDKLAGSSLKASGQINNLDGIPQLKNIRLQAEASDVSRLIRLAGGEAAVDSKKLGVVSFIGKAEGSVLNPHVDLDLKGAGTSLGLVGKLSLLPMVGGFDGKLKVAHSDVVKMLKSLSIDYKPGGKLGGLKLESLVKADMSGLTLNAVSAQVGPVNINGTAKVALDGPRTKISANLNTDRIVADLFLPVSGAAWVNDPARPVAAAFISPGVPVGKPSFKRLITFAKGRWPTTPIDLSALKIFDADIKVKSAAIVFGNYQLNNADLAATVNDGLLRVEKFNGGLFGGVIDATANVRAASPSSIDTVISLKNLDVAQGLKAVIGESPAAGRAAMDLNLTSSGYTVSDLVAALGGKGAIALKGLDVDKAGKGTALSAALGLVAGLNNLGGALSGKKAGAGLADITGNFNIAKGIARTNDLALTSPMGKGRAQGNIDLSRWLIDVAGQVEMSQNVLGAILNGGQKVPSLLPFSIKGNLDAPNVKLDTSKLQGAGLPIPGLQRILKKKGLGNILKQIIPGLGGSSTSQPPAPSPSTSSGNTPPPPPPPAPPPAPQTLKPQDLLKGLLKGLSN